MWRRLEGQRYFKTTVGRVKMNISPISLAFQKCKREKRPALLTYTVAGDNTKKKSLEILNAISNYVDICEIGIPHSTPTADGGDIQTSSYRSLKNGFKMRDAFQIVKSFKKNNKEKPVIYMMYYNMIYQYGENRFIKKCKQVGVDGLIVVDLPWPDNRAFSKKCKKNSLSFVQLLSPTTSKARQKKIINSSHEMLYYISMLSTTGGKLKVSPKEILRNYNKIRRLARGKYVVIGFGITKKTIASLRESDGLVVGSACCKAITNSIKKRHNPVITIRNMVKNLRRIIR
jgi:tryptophan synthase alpha chain